MADTNEKSYSGELFDLSIPSTNDKFGAMHNIGVMQYGINFPLSKFIKELKLIIGNGSDDKTAKRQLRLDFLEHCNGNKELRQFFILFCNYLNGRDGDGTQWPNYMVITAAGGNIMILFAQLIKNIIDNLNFPGRLMSSNTILLAQLEKFTGTSIQNIKESIKNHFTEPDMLKSLEDIAESEPSDCDFKLSPNIIPLIDNTAVDIISKMLQELEIEPAIGGNAKIGGVNPPINNPFGSPSVGAFNFGSRDYREGSDSMDFESSPPLLSQMSSHSLFSELEDDSSPSKIEQLIEQLQTITNIAKLTEIFDKIKIDATLKDIDSVKLEEFIEVLKFLYEKIGSSDEEAGFLLYRIKTLITCIEGFIPTHTPKEIQKYKEDCSEKHQKLYPQIIQQQDLDDITDTNSGCFKYLTYLMKKKKIIRWLTTIAVNEIIKFYKRGEYKRAHLSGITRSTFEPASNSTDALINYIRTVTSNTNNYIGHWLTGKLLPASAPGYHNGEKFTISYIDVCKNFSSLKKIVEDNNGMIPFLCGDILHYFLNFPTYNSETILDNILKRFNKERKLAKKSQGIMPPSIIRLVYSPIYSKYLELSKQILQTKLEETGENLGLPDGTHLTINPVITTGIQDIEDIIDIARALEFETEFETEFGRESGREFKRRTTGGTKYYKKNITLKNKKMVKNIKVVKKTQEKLKTKLKKTRRQKNLRKVTLKHKKSRKHKSMKHKQRQNKI